MIKTFLPALRRTSAAIILITGTASTVAEDANGHVPKKAGQCVRTEISELGSRLEGSPDSGSAIAYTNGVTGVSYDIITAIRRSRVGDPITLCLVSVPRNCPPGDDRGKVYSAVNGRTQERWSCQIVSIAAAARRQKSALYQTHQDNHRSRRDDEQSLMPSLRSCRFLARFARPHSWQ